MSEPGVRVAIVAGEASGDLHAARLVEEVRRLRPEVSFAGIGGPRMAAAGVRVLVDSASLAVMGLVEVLAHYSTLKAALERMREHLRTERPDLLVLVDYPDFNLRLARTAKALGIRVLYYVSPQVWAWRRRRVHRIRRLVDRMAVVFPFEVPFYREAGVPVEFVGHPLVDEVPEKLTPAQARARLGLSGSGPVIGLLPGSRRAEIERLLPPLLDAARRLRERFPAAVFLLPVAPMLDAADIRHRAEAAGVPIRLVENDPYGAIASCDAVATASGTATLETALLGVPMVVVYRMAPITYHIMRHLVRIPHISLCNIVAGRAIVPELIQHEANGERIAQELLPLLEDPEAGMRMRAELTAIRARLGVRGASERAARALLDLVPAPPA